MSGVVFNAFAVPYFGEHLQVKPGALLQPLGFDQLALADKLFEAVRQLDLDGLDRHQHLLARRHIVAAGVDSKARNLLPDAPRERVKQLQGLDLVVEQLHADGHLGVLRRKNINGVAPHAEGAAREIHVVPLVLHAHQLNDHVALAELVARAQRHDHLVVRLGLANTVDRRHRGHDDHIAPLQHALGTRQAHLLNVLIDRGVFFNKQVTLRHIGLGLVVVVVADEVLHRVFGEKLAELAVELRRQRFVGCKHDGRAAQAGNHIGHGEGFARARHAQQGLEHFAVVHAFHQLVNRLGLVTCGRIRLVQLERRVGKGHKRPWQGRGGDFNKVGHRNLHRKGREA